MNTPGLEASMTLREKPQRNANCAYLCLLGFKTYTAA
jgi:hypothetical protein